VYAILSLDETLGRVARQLEGLGEQISQAVRRR
jgi:hypothetical protein